MWLFMLHVLDIREAVDKFTEFYDVNGLVRYEFVLPGQSVTGYFYVQVLQRLRVAVWKKQHNKGQGQWFLHHDNTPSHTGYHDK
jgi:hypothetical protein